MRSTARIFFGGLLSLLLFVFVGVLPVHAQTSSYMAPNTEPNVPNNLHTYTQNVFLEVMSTIVCQLGGVDITHVGQPCLGFNASTGKIGYTHSSGLIGLTTYMIASLYTPPAHLGDFTQDLANNFGIAKHAYAQGVGYQSISPLIEIWKVSRNMVYLVFVVVFVLVGFAIMFRFQIDPRTVMSIENQLPKLTIGLLLVTFSFAIAGLLIDAMWTTTFLVTNIVVSVDNGYANSPDANVIRMDAKRVNTSLFENPLGFANNILPNGIFPTALGAGGSFRDVLLSILTPGNTARLGLSPPPPDCENGTPFIGFFGTAWCNFSDNIGGHIADLLGEIFGAVIANIIGALGVAIVLIAIIIAMVRVWFTLLIAYVYILLDIVMGPFMILFGMFPGSKLGFGSWARDLLANLMSFPVTIGLFLIGRLFMDAFTGPNQTQALFVPPLIGNPNGTSGAGNPLGWLLGLAIILITPGIVNTMRELFKAPQSKLGAQVFQGLSMGGKAVTSLGRGVFGAFTGNDIRYKEDGSIETIKGPVRKALHRISKSIGG